MVDACNPSNFNDPRCHEMTTTYDAYLRKRIRSHPTDDIMLHCRISSLAVRQTAYPKPGERDYFIVSAIVTMSSIVQR
jgi:hypothetical protein